MFGQMFVRGLPALELRAKNSVLILCASAARLCVPVVVALGTLLAATVVYADSFWQASSGEWSNATNWNGGVPTSSTVTYIENGGTVSITQPSEVCTFLTLNVGGGGETPAYLGIVQMTTGQLNGSSAWGTEWIGYTGTGVFTQSGGTNAPNSLGLGYYSGNGTYSLSGGVLSVGGGEVLGDGSTGTFMQSGGSNNVNTLNVGCDDSGTGTYTLSNGLLSVQGNVYVGYSSSGSFTQSGGAHNINNGALYLGYNSGSNGSYSLGAGTLLTNQISGGAGTGIFSFNGGLLQATVGASSTFISGLTNAYVQSGGANIDTNGQNITISQPLLDGGGGGGLTKYGLGMLSVTGSNTYTGGTAVSGGTLQLGNSAALGSGGLTVGNSGTVDVNGCVVSLPWLNGVAGAVITDNSIPLSTPAPTVLTVNVLFGVSTYGGSILKGANGQDLGLTETGYGTLILSGSSNYSGGTIISGGTLQIGNGGSGEGLASPIITNNGSLVFNHADALTIAASISGSGCLSKTSDGTLILTGSNTYSGGTTVIAGTLQGNAASLQSSIVNNASVVFDQAITGTYGGLMSGSGGLTKIDIGTLILTGSNTYSGGTTVSQGVLQGNAVSLQGNILNNASVVFDQPVPGTYGGSISGSGSLTKIGNDTLTLSGSSNYSGGTNINQGTLNVSGAIVGGGNVLIGDGSTLGGPGLVQGNIVGEPGSAILASGNLTLGDSTSYTGFNHAGTLIVGSNTVTLNSAAFANLGVLTTLDGGTLAAPNGMSLGVGCNLVGSGVVNGKIAAGYGSTINATGNLTLGDSSSPVGFVSNGELYTNANTVTLNSFNAANNQNAVVLGSLTELEGGSLVAPNGILLENGDNLVTTDAGGTVSGGSASRFLNRGNVQGPSSASSNWLIFKLLFKGSTGQTSGRIGFLGGFATGDSPGVNTQYGATLLGGTGTEFDIGGITPGNSNNNYGQLNILTNPQDLSNHGDLILLPGTDLNIVDWNGFVPAPGEEFTVLTWSGALSGTASLAIDPAFASHGIQFVPQWNSNSLVVEAVPEPSTLVLLGVGVMGLMGYALRRRTFEKMMVRGLSAFALRVTIVLALLLSVSSLARGQDVLTLTTPGAGSIMIPTGDEWTNVTVQCWGGGGGGGGTYGGCSMGGGGGGGAYSSNTYPMLVAGTYNYYVGAGGAGGAGVANGAGYTGYGGGSSGSTIWNYGGTQDIIAGGGAGGGGGGYNGPSWAAGGTGGAVAAGTGYPGGDGGGGYFFSYAAYGTGGGGGGGGGSGGPGGPGGPGPGGQGGGGSGGAGYGPGGNGNNGIYGAGAGGNGSFPGGGGGGAGTYNYLAYSGGQGANGEIIITYTPGALGLLSVEHDKRHVTRHA